MDSKTQQVGKCASPATGERMDDGGRVLLIAYHFPPEVASTGRLRTLGFMRHLPAFGWEPCVLTAQPRAYGRIDENGCADIPDPSRVYRALAFDTMRHMGWRGKHLSWLATPDRWVSWWPDAVRKGLSIIRRQNIDVIWSTYPILTAHMIALTLSRITGLPWLADFRDPVTSKSQAGFNYRSRKWLERRSVRRASRLVFTTPSACQRYRERFRGQVNADKFKYIPNGYEEALFNGLTRSGRAVDAPCTLVHSGLLYRDGRNPAAFFRALVALKKRGLVTRRNLHIVLRASGGNEDEYRAELVHLALDDIVEMAPAVNYRVALQEQATADGLLLFQGTKFNAQIPAKVYEYLRVGVPIFALTDASGDTAELLQEFAGATIVPMDDEAAIAESLADFLSRWRGGTLVAPDAGVTKNYSRYAGAERLATIMAEVKNK